jgi:cytochrome c oxidase subunit 3
VRARCGPDNQALEYSREIAHGLAPWLADSSFTLAAGKPAHNELFFNFYFAMTGLHALHLAAGIVTVLVVIVYLLRHQTPAAVAQIETAGLYWHFVDVVWIFLYPALYLIPS